MKKIFLAIAVMFTMVACTQNKPSQATENVSESAVQTEAVDSIDPQTKLKRSSCDLAEVI